MLKSRETTCRSRMGAMIRSTLRTVLLKISRSQVPKHYWYSLLFPVANLSPVHFSGSLCHRLYNVAFRTVRQVRTPPITASQKCRRHWNEALVYPPSEVNPASGLFLESVSTLAFPSSLDRALLQRHILRDHPLTNRATTASLHSVGMRSMLMRCSTCSLKASIHVSRQGPKTCIVTLSV